MRNHVLTNHPGAEVVLRKSGGGVFEIVVDGRLAFSKRAVGRFPNDKEIASALG